MLDRALVDRFSVIDLSDDVFDPLELTFSIGKSSNMMENTSQS